MASGVLRRSKFGSDRLGLPCGPRSNFLLATNGLACLGAFSCGMVLPKGLILSVGIIPFERVIRSIYEEDIPIDEELMEELQNDKDYNI